MLFLVRQAVSQTDATLAVPTNRYKRRMLYESPKLLTQYTERLFYPKTSVK